nr:hypothetical protein [Tanacetum cinerariifolium]
AKIKEKQRKETEIPHIEPHSKKSIATPSNDPLPSGEDRMKLTELMNLCTNLEKQVLDLEKAKTAQAKEIADLKKRLKKLERKKKSRTPGLKRMYKVGLSARIVSSDEKGLGDQEDASKQVKIAEIDANEYLSLIDETVQDQGRMNEKDLFGVNNLDGDEVIVDVTAGENVEQDATIAKKEVSTVDPVTTAGEVVTTGEDVEVTTATATTQISKDDVTLAQTLIEIKAAKPRARGVIVQEPQGYKQKDFKGKGFDAIKNIFDKAYKRVNTFVDMNTEIMGERLNKTQAEVTEGSSKRAGDEIEQESVKRQREDLEVLRSIVKTKFEKTKPVNDMDSLLFQTLKTMFEHQRSKEDHVGHISISIFVTNFPDDVGSSDLWKVCEGYGKMVDLFIPNRRSKAGKRFAFVRFIRADNIDRLVRNLCTIWIGRFHLYVNVVRFERASKHVSLASNTQANVHGKVGSYATAVRGKTPLNVPITPVSSTPTLILDEACAITHDLSRHVMGKVKDINSISNLRTLLAKEGFPKAKLTFLGRLWDASHDFVSDERVVWVDLEGVPLNLWSRETFLKIDNKRGEALDIEDNSGSSFAHKRLCVITKQPDSILEKFKVIYKGRVFFVRAKELFTWTPIFLEPQEMVYTSDGESVHGRTNSRVVYNLVMRNQMPVGDKQSESPSLSHPLGFSPIVSEIHKDGDLANVTTVNGVDNENTPVVNAQVMNNSQELLDSPKADSTSLNSGPIHNGGSILNVLEDMDKVGLGHKSKKEWIKELNYKHKFNFLALQETKLERVTHMDVKLLWGNSNYQFIASDSVRSSGGECRWDGEAIVMGDFNDVRCKEERLGSLFNSLSVRVFNRFIEPVRLVEVKLEGYSFTWSHPSAAKMSKLDRFLVTDGILSLFPSITALCLDRHLSDHRPILLHEVKDRKSQQFGVKNTLISELGDIDKALDQEGDENSKFFHGIINKKRSQLLIRGVFVDGLWCTDPCKVKETFRNHFQARFNQPSLGRFKLNFVFTNRLSPDQVVDLDSNVSRDEIRKAVWDCGENKSPGPDGYTPISLIGCVYKVVTKILANRLAMVILDLISDTQSAFVAKRQILDGPFILNELLNWCKKTKKQALFFKVNFAKAYDSAAAKIGCAVLHHQFRYLGVMVGECMSRRSAWDGLVHKLRSRLSKWKVKTLSIGGRLNLLKSVLGASPLHNMSIFKIPKGVLKDMEAIRSKFFNGADSSERKITESSFLIYVTYKYKYVYKHRRKRNVSTLIV